MNVTLPQPGPPPPGAPPPSGPAGPATARTRRSRISLVWLIPVVAALIAAFLGYRNVQSRGPTIELSFRTGDGLAAGQTRVRHKAVALGTVESIRLSDDMSRVVVSVRMTREAAPYLTDRARFWVVRPRLTRSSADWISASVKESSAEVASSSTRIGGALRMVRAMATRCFSPPDSFRPRSPTGVS